MDQESSPEKSDIQISQQGKGNMFIESKRTSSEANDLYEQMYDLFIALKNFDESTSKVSSEDYHTIWLSAMLKEDKSAISDVLEKLRREMKPLMHTAPKASQQAKDTEAVESHRSSQQEVIPFPPQHPDANEEETYITKTVHFAANSYSVLEELAERSSIGEALQDAIALSKWFKDVRERGDKLLIERKGILYEVEEIN